MGQWCPEHSEHERKCGVARERHDPLSFGRGRPSPPSEGLLSRGSWEPCTCTRTEGRVFLGLSQQSDSCLRDSAALARATARAPEAGRRTRVPCSPATWGPCLLSLLSQAGCCSRHLPGHPSFLVLPAPGPAPHRPMLRLAGCPLFPVPRAAQPRARFTAPPARYAFAHSGCGIMNALSCGCGGGVCSYESCAFNDRVVVGSAGQTSRGHCRRQAGNPNALGSQWAAGSGLRLLNTDRVVLQKTQGGAPGGPTGQSPTLDCGSGRDLTLVRMITEPLQALPDCARTRPPP